MVMVIYLVVIVAFFYFFFQNLSIFLFDIGIPLFYRAFSTHGKNDILVLNFEAVLLIVRLKDKEVLLSPDIHRPCRRCSPHGHSPMP